MKSRTIVNASIFVTSITILAVLLSWFSSLVLKTSLNSPIYYGIVIVLSIISIVFGILQWTPALLELGHARSARQTRTPSIESENEQQALYVNLASTLTELPARQRNAMLYPLLERINFDIRSKQQNYPVKVTMEIKGSPVMIEMPDVEKVENIIKRIAQGIQASSNITDIETRDTDSVLLEAQASQPGRSMNGNDQPASQTQQESASDPSDLDRTLATLAAALAADLTARRQVVSNQQSDQTVSDQAEQSIIREEEGSYQVDDTSAQK